MSDEDFLKAKNYALRLLSLRPRSIKEIKLRLNHYLKRKNLRPSFSVRVIEELKDSGYLDDANFADWWINARRHNSIRGKKVIRAELRAKGVDREIIDQVLEKTSVDEEIEKAQRLIAKKLPRFISSVSREKYKARIRTLLYRRGFDPFVIEKAIDERPSRV